MNNQLRAAIAQGKTKQVIAKLLTLTTSDPDLHNQVLHLSARFAQYEKQKLGNLEDSSVLGIELNRINHSTLAIIEELQVDDSPLTNSPYFSKQKLIWWGSGLIALITILANLATILDFLGIKPKDEGQVKNVTVNVRDKEGALVESLHTKGYVIMTTSGGGAPKELIDDRGAASFKNIKVGDKGV